MVMAPVVRGRKGEYGKLLDEIRAQGYARAMVDGELRRLDEKIDLDKKYKHDISVVVDRLVMKPDLRKRLADSVETATALADGHRRGRGARRRRSPRLLASASRASSAARRSPSSSRGVFSFNSPHGACPRCHGLGFQRVIDPELIVPGPDAVDHRRRAGTVQPLRVALPPQPVRGDCREQGHRPRHAVAGPAAQGPRGDPVRHRGCAPRGQLPQPLRPPAPYTVRFDGILGELERRYRSTDSDKTRERIEQAMALRPCPDCDGAGCGRRRSP